MGKLTDKIKKTFRNFWNSIPMSVYVALDENGNPVEMARGDGPTSPNMRGREQNDYKYFVRRLVKHYGRGDHIPDFQFVRFDFPNQWKVPLSGGNIVRYYQDKLLPAAGKQHVEADKRISLRDAVFIIKSGLPLFDATTEHGRLARRKDYKEYIAHNEQGRWKEFMQEKGSKYTAVATDRGVMLFSQTRIGEKALHTYLQECADNYFHPMKSTGMLRIYEVSSPTADVAAKADNYIDRLSRRDQRSDSAGLRYSRYGTDPGKMLSADVLIGAVCTEKYDMRPDFHDFDRFTGDNALKTDRKNYEIATLLYIAENGFADHLAADYFHPFDRMADFRPLAEKLGDTMRAKSENPQSEHEYAALQQEANALARDMLESDYHIRDGEFALGQSAGKMLPSVPALSQQPILRPAEAPAPTNRPTMKPSGTVAQQPVRRVPSVKSSRGKGHSVS